LVEEATAAAESLQWPIKLDDAYAYAVPLTDTAPLPIPDTDAVQSVPLALQRQRSVQSGLLGKPRKRAA